jgi:hypothetical protein
MIALEDRYKIAFITNWGPFFFIVMPFGLKNAPPTYQEVMSMAFCSVFNHFWMTSMYSMT